MHSSVIFDPDLIRRYDVQGPRYTSYPTAVSFTPEFGPEDFVQAASESNGLPIPAALSLYVHVPFCESLCYYCACNKIVTRHREKCDPYLEQVIAEADLVSPLFDPDRRVEQLHFGGGTPTYFTDEQLRNLMTALDQRFAFADPELREFSIEIDPRTVDPDRVASLAGMGFNRLSLGIQDFDPKVQVAVNRVQSFDMTAAVIEAARENQFRSISVDLIYGLPFQSVATFDRTLDQVISIRPDRISVYNYAHLPDRFRAQRLIEAEDLPSATEKLALLNLTVTKLGQAGYEYIGMDHFALPQDELVIARDEGSLQRNFQGYSTRAHCDLIGLGVSSISHIGPSFSQNAVAIKDYQTRVEEKQLGAVRGTWMSLDDQIRADVISRIMCQSALPIGAIEKSWDIQFDSYFKDAVEQLKPLIDDGLLAPADDGFQVTPSGRMLLRNIAMCFDAHLPGHRQQQRFSKAI
jgi:oxygen-independent coproporphyrinogen-3 oxidase